MHYFFQRVLLFIDRNNLFEDLCGEENDAAFSASFLRFFEISEYNGIDTLIAILNSLTFTLPTQLRCLSNYFFLFWWVCFECKFWFPCLLFNHFFDILANFPLWTGHTYVVTIMLASKCKNMDDEHVHSSTLRVWVYVCICGKSLIKILTRRTLCSLTGRGMEVDENYTSFRPFEHYRSRVAIMFLLLDEFRICVFLLIMFLINFWWAEIFLGGIKEINFLASLFIMEIVSLCYEMVDSDGKIEYF